MRVLRLLGLAALGAFATASTCDGNVGDGETRGRETVRISQRADGGQASADSENPNISADGRFVVFESSADDLVFPDGNGWRDIFLKDRATGEIVNVTRVSPSITVGGNLLTNILDDAFSPSVSADGRYVAFLSKGAFGGPLSIPGGGSPHLTAFVLDRDTGLFDNVIVRTVGAWPNRALSDLTMSDDGRYVAFRTAASNIGYSNGNFSEQAYVADLSVLPHTITLVSRSLASATTISNGGGVSEVRMSRDGSSVVFLSEADNLNAGNQRHIFLGTPAGDVPEMVTVQPGTSTPSVGNYYYPCVSATGRFVACYSEFSDIPAVTDDGIMRFDRGIPGEVAPSAAFLADDMWVQIFPAVSGTGTPFAIAADGSIAYRGYGVITSVYARRDASAREIVSVSSSDVLGDLTSQKPAISGDGRWVVWESPSTNLIEGDTNLKTDIFVRGPLR